MTRLTFLLIGSLVLGLFAACAPQRLRGWVSRRLRSFPSLHDLCLRLIDQLLTNLDRRYPVLVG